MKDGTRRYFSLKCVPRELKVRAGRASKEKGTFWRRRKAFDSEVRRLQALGRISAMQLLAAFQLVADRYYDSGYHASDNKWRNRLKVGELVEAARGVFARHEQRQSSEA